MRKNLTSAQVAALWEAGTHRVERNLYLMVRPQAETTWRSWLFRYKRNGRTHWLGLGTLLDVTLTEARSEADDARRLLRKGIDPIQHRKAERRRVDAITFEQAADDYVAAHKAAWSSPKHGTNWLAQLKKHAHPVIGKMTVDLITANDVVRALQPIWTTLPTTAGKVRQRVEAVLDYARVAGHRPEGINPATWRGNLEHRLPALGRIQRVVHRIAVPWRDAPRVFAALAGVDRSSSRLLRFLALTAVRYAEGAGARWEEFSDLDGETPTWTIPPERAKTRKGHRVPLAPAAVAVLKEAKASRLTSAKPSDLVFRGTAPGRPPSDVTLRTLLRKHAAPDADVHGWRSTFRDWAADHGYAREVAEAALAHTVGSKVEAAYFRSDLYERRVPLMEAWAEYLSPGRNPNSGI